VDIYRSGNEIFVRVVDYKTGSKSFSLDDLALGLNTQMLLYLFALCSKDRGNRILNTDLVPVPSGVVYLSSNIPTIELETSEDDELTEKKAAAAFKRSGLLLSDEDVLKAMNDELSPAFLAGVKKNKSGELSGDSLVSLERFAELKAEIETVITDIILQMKSGKADAAPLIYKGDSPCDFCEMRPVCRVVENKNASESYSDGEKG
jgi:ATP-dependent helicase/nuclease subunit B